MIENKTHCMSCMSIHLSPLPKSNSPPSFNDGKLWTEVLWASHCATHLFPRGRVRVGDLPRKYFVAFRLHSFKILKKKVKFVYLFCVFFSSHYRILANSFTFVHFISFCSNLSRRYPLCSKYIFLKFNNSSFTFNMFIVTEKTIRLKKIIWLN